MAKHSCISLDNPAEWKEALSGLNYSFGHTWESCHGMNLTTQHNLYLYKYESDDVRIVCPLAEREFSGYRDIVTPYGFSGFAGNADCPDFPDSWKEFVNEREYVCGYIGQNPVFDNSTYYRSGEMFYYNNLYVIDLALDEDTLYRNLSTNRRRQLRGWEEQAKNIVLDRPALVEFFLAHYHDFMQSKNAAGVYSFSDETLLFLLDPDLENIHIVGMRHEDRLVAVSVYAHTRDMAEYLFNVSLPEGRQYAVPLLWHGVKYLKARNVRYFNLGGGVSLDDSVAGFKQRFGAMEIPLGSIKQVYRRDIYTQLCASQNVDPEEFTGYFPAYRQNRNG